jgi:uncharacterized phiE125 gp8 family phage protein
MYGLTITTPPTIEPITTANAKVHCEIPAADTTHDAYLDMLVQAAREHYEQRTNRALINRTLTMTLDGFPTGDDPIYLPQSPVSSVTSIAYVDENGATQTWANTNYTLIKNQDPARVVLAYDKVWPAIRYQAQAVTIVYVAGYGATAATVPMRCIHALKLLIRHWFENRSPISYGTAPSNVPLAFEALCEADRVGDDFLIYGKDHYAA